MNETQFADRIEAARQQQRERELQAAALRAELELATQIDGPPVDRVSDMTISDLVTGNHRTRGWFADASAAAVRGIAKFPLAVGRLTHATGDIRLNIGNGRPLIEMLSPEEAAARAPEGIERALQAGVDSLGAPQTTVGAITESAVQFLAGFKGVDKIAKAAFGLSRAGNAVSVTRGLAQGAITSAVAFEGSEKNLANLLQSIPALQNPVSEFLAVDDDTGELEGRLKNAITDAIGGAAVESMLAGFRAIKVIRATRSGAEGFSSADPSASANGQSAASPDVTPSTPTASLREINLADVRIAADEPQAVPERAPKSEPHQGTPGPGTGESTSTVDYGKLGDDDNVKRLSERLGIDDAKIAELRRRVADGEVKPEQVSELIGINPERIDWSNVKDADGMVGLLNSVTRVMDDAVASAAGYKPVSIEQMAKHAGDMGGSFDEAVGLWERLRDAPAAVMAQRATLMASAQRLQNLVNKVRSGTATNAERLELAVHDRRHALLQTIARGTRAEIGRALRVMREGVTVNEGALRLSRARQMREQRAAQEAADKASVPATLQNLPATTGKELSDADLSTALEGLGMSLDDLNRLADELALRPELSSLNAASRTVLKEPTVTSRLLSLYVNNLLSGLPTMAINVYSVAQRAIENVAEKFGAQALGLRESDKWDRAVAAKSTVALMSSWRTAWTMAGKAWREGLPQLDIEARHEAMKYGATGITGNARVDAVLTAPTRVILTVDEFAKQIFYHQELTARAVEVSAHAARLAGTEGDSVFRETLEQTLRNPPDDLALDAVEHARRSTFQDQFTDERMIALQRFLGAIPVLRFAVPFVRTPANILWQGFAERTPLGLLSRKLRDELRQPGRRGREAQVRMLMGTAAVGIFTALAEEGRVTGSRRAGRDSKALDGAPAYSIKIGDTWIQYNRFDPIGTVLGFAADMRRLFEDDSPDTDGLGAAVLALTVQNLTDKTFFRGISDLIEAAGGLADGKGTDAAKKYIAGIASNLVPYSAMQRNLAKQHDEYAREAWTFVDRLIAQTPVASKALPLRRDLLGRPIVHTGRLGLNLASPFLVGKDDPDPVAREIAALQITYRPLEKDIGGVKLTPAQYSRLTELTGRRLHATMSEWMRSREWQTMSKPMKAEIFERLYSSARAAGKGALYEEDPKLLQKVVGAKESARAVLLGE